MPRCGDGVIDDGEDCDGAALGAGTCQAMGFDTGKLSCDTTCHYSTATCVKKCGNGVLDLGEPCDGQLGLVPCTTWGYPECTATCELDTRHCVTTAFELAPQLDLGKGGPAVLGDLSPAGPGDLVMAVPSFSRVEAFSWDLVLGFDPTTGKKLALPHQPLLAQVCDVNGDGNQDVVTIATDGTVDQLVFSGAVYSLQSIDAGVNGGTFVGSGPLGRDGAATRDAVVAVPNAFVVLGNGQVARRLEAPDAGASTLDDLDGDGLRDLSFVDGAGALRLWLAPGFVDDGGVTLPAAPTAIALGDLDGDDDADLAAVVGDQVQVFERTASGFTLKATFPAVGASQVLVLDLDLDGRRDVVFATSLDVLVRRNRGGWVFTEFATNAGPGPRLSVAVGDADGDGDPDLAVTVSTGGDATRTVVVRNRVR